ncbi:MAG: hypothetical protein EAZ57_03625 [Cytophagales bacterium]|nr:MAG: hypothetical protein EAZ67_04090 [Cytophagales bacterium]TAF61552.1 MAG: hypothetical protein EAZ57_03625 [Cytophagales bacterium]
MKGTIKELIEHILNEYAQGDPLSRRLIETKFYLRGINIGDFKEDTPDSPAIMERIKAVEKELKAVYG